jgi:acyl-CoA thioester hydrolase
MRWGDMDAFGHVNNVHLARYLEQARVDLLFRAGASGPASMAEGVVLAELTIRYKAPLVYRPEPVLVDVWVTRIGNSAFDFAYEVHDLDGPTYAEATSVQVPYDLKDQRPRRLTEDEQEFLRRLHEPAA